jgi:hypothetical protein
MTDFEVFLATALAPEDREPDRLFVARMQAQVRLDARLTQARGAMARRLGLQLLGIAAVAAAVLIVAESPAAGRLIAYSPEIFVLSLLAAFGFVVAMFSAAPQSRRGALG